MSKIGKRIVQFHHNGPEHLVDEIRASFTAKKKDVRKILDGSMMPWNDGDHRRKFIKSFGKYVDEKDQAHEGEIMFWGEYEACSEVKKIEYEEKPSEYMPRYIHTPIYKKLNEYIKAPTFPVKSREEVLCWQNTDPYVFGNFIIYSNCHMGKHDFLKKLEQKSVVVMGSKKGEFRADTVLVIDKPLAVYNKNNYKEVKELLDKGIISQVFWDTTIVPLLGLYESEGENRCGIRRDDDAPVYTIYKTVTYEERENFNGMYSFFPCKPYDENTGFERVKVKDEKYLNPNLGMNVKAAEIISDENEMFNLWNSVKEQVLNDGQGLKLGIWAKEPEK
jgi:hypothetical protein